MKTQLNELALFAGAGGGILGGKLLGWRTVCAVEWDAYARDVLVARQNDGCLEAFPIWDDVQTFDGKPWRGRVDVVSGGFPCQDISCAGKGAGIEGDRSSMWKHMARIIGEVLPQYVFVENSPMLVGRGLAVVLADFSEMGYDAKWGIVGAHHAGAPHKRDRIWIVADARGEGLQGCEQPRALRDERDREEAHGSTGECGSSPGSTIRHAPSAGLPHRIDRTMGQPGAEPESERSDWWATEPDVGRVAHGVAARVDRLRCIGNGQVPAVAQLAWETLRP
jgi:DNA (cytosine-5)-methyltransferase 1